MTGKRHSFLKLAAAKLMAKEPFCLARFPGEKKFFFYQQPTQRVQNNIDSFLVKGWNKSDATYYYASANGSEQDANQAGKANSSEEIPIETSFETYSANFKSYQHAFANTKVKKAILSRLKLIDISVEFDLMAYFERLESAHANALVYILLHPTEGLWIGASPEILISRKGNKYTTVSLAGTQKISASTYVWGEKEKEEQEFVSAHIRESLTRNGIKFFTESVPETAEAGSVAHLKTTFQFEAKDLNLLKIADQLHPTPAISGTPIPEALSLINATETHSRQLYTGYLGRVCAQTIDLYVNLRCMQVFPNKMVLYLGGGITQSSQLEAEWEETEQKAKTLLKQING